MSDPVSERDGLRSRVEKAEQALERLRAAVRLVYPDDMTPAGKRVFDQIFAALGEGSSNPTLAPQNPPAPFAPIFDDDDEPLSGEGSSNPEPATRKPCLCDENGMCDYHAATTHRLPVSGLPQPTNLGHPEDCECEEEEES